MRQIRIGIVGYGNIGKAAASILQARANEIVKRSAVCLGVSVVCRRSPELQAPPEARSVSDWRQVVEAEDVDIVVETIGGTEVAYQVVRSALERGKPVVTANKNLLATHGDELFTLASQKKLPLAFEATVAGGVPVLRAITEGAAGDYLTGVYGILNGTANYILTEMEGGQLRFADALKKAQQAGYAEPDPAMDVDGIDARDKLSILARLVFGRRLPAARIPVTGIRAISAVDMQYARRLDSCIRLIAAAELNGDRVEVSVRPWLVAKRSMLGKVEGVNNAVFLVGERLGTQMFYGAGAGPDATGAAVVADLVEISRDLEHGQLTAKNLPGFQGAEEVSICTNPRPRSWYLRLTVRDRPGIIARVAEAIARYDVNIDSVFQEPHMSKERLSFIVTVEPMAEPTMLHVLKEINRYEFMLEPVLLLRIAEEPRGE